MVWIPPPIPMSRQRWMPMVGYSGVESFPADESGFEASIGWLSSHGGSQLVGVEGSGSWDVGLALFLHNHEISVVEADRPNRQDYGSISDPVGPLQAGGPWVRCRTVASACPRGERVMPCWPLYRSIS